MPKKKTEHTDSPTGEVTRPATKKPTTKAKTPSAVVSNEKPTRTADKSAGGTGGPTGGKTPSKSPAKAKPNLLGAPLIDTGLAASAAASLLVARRRGRDQVGDPISIDQIKSDLSKAANAGAGELIDQHAASSGTRRPNLPHTGPAGNSQTVGHAAERTFVPRRTGG